MEDAGAEITAEEDNTDQDDDDAFSFVGNTIMKDMSDTHDEICQKAIAKNVEEIAINLRNLSVNGYDTGRNITEFYEKTCVAMSYISGQLSGDPAIHPAHRSRMMDQLSGRLKEDLDDDAHERYADQCVDECDREQTDEDRRMDQNKRKKHYPKL